MWTAGRRPNAASLMAGTLAVILAGMPQPLTAQPFAAPGPVVTVPVGPGGVTISWDLLEYPDLAGFVVERETPPLKVEKRRIDRQHLDSYLQPNTDYRYRVCAVYALSTKHEQKCSEWVPARTGAPQPPTTRVRRPAPQLAAHEISTNHITVRWLGESFERFHIRWEPKRGDAGFSGREAQLTIDHTGREGYRRFDGLFPSTTYLFKVQGCTINIIGIANCGEWSAPFEIRTATPLPAAPVVTATAAGPRAINLRWPVVTTPVTSTEVFRNGESINFTYAETGRFDDTAVRPNSERVTYRVCRRNEAGLVCSADVVARPQPVAPSAPGRLVVRQIGQLTGGDPRSDRSEALRVTAHITEVRWENARAAAYIPGRYLIVERLDTGPGGGREALERVVQVWREVGRVEAATDPTRLSVTSGREVGYRAGNQYRVCAVVPELRAAGKVCSAPASAGR
jgi:hypothetical protein